MFSFQWPWIALLLPLPWLVWRLWSARHRGLDSEEEAQQPVLLHPSIERLEHAFAPAPPGVAPHEWLQVALLALLWALLVVTLMGPQWLEEQTEVASRGYDLMLAVDTSRSMLAQDFTLDGVPVTRMAVIKGVAGRFVEHRQGDRIGLVLFGDEAVMQAPLTLDASAVRTLLDSAEPGVAGDGTAIGDAIGVAVKKLRERPAESRVLILVTDGENTAGMSPLEAARLAQKYKVRIYTIGVGSKGKVPFPDAYGRLEMRDDLKIDEGLLQQLASETGGAYFRATDTQALEQIYRRIDSLEKTQAETRTTMIPEPLYRWPLGAALAVLLLVAGLALGLGRRSDRVSA